MKYLIILTLLVNNSNSVSYYDKINWKTNLEEAIKLARAENKNIFIYFGANWCAPCRIIEANVFSEPEFIEFSKDFIMVKIYDDYKRGNKKEQEYFKNKKAEYDVEYIPCCIILDKNKEKARLSGIFRNPNDLIKEINSYK